MRLTELNLIYISLLSFLCILLIFTMRIPLYGEKKIFKKSEKYISVFGLTAFIILTGASFFVNYNTIKGIKFYDNDEFDTAIKYIERSSIILEYGSIFRKIPVFSLLQFEDLLNYAGLSYYKIKDDKHAISYLKKSLEINSDQFSPHVYLAKSFQNIGEIQQAIKEHKIIIDFQTDDKNFFYYNNLGQSCVFMGLFSKALNSFNNAIILQSERKDIYLNLAECYSMLDNKSKAIDALRKVVNFDKRFICLGFNNPLFNNIREHTEFKNIISQINLIECEPYR